MSRQQPRLWIVDPSVEVPEDEGVANLSEGFPGEVRLFRPCLEPGSGPEPATGYDTDGIVVLGSRASVHESSPWLAKLAAWLQPIVSGDVRRPLLGICFGHQLLGHLAGARVGPLRPDRSKLVGVETTRFNGGTLLPGFRELRVIVSHREHVEHAPRGWRVTATRAEVPIDAFEHPVLPIYGMQFHPEAGPEFASRQAIDLGPMDEASKREIRELLQAFRSRVTRKAAAERL